MSKILDNQIDTNPNLLGYYKDKDSLGIAYRMWAMPGIVFEANDCHGITEGSVKHMMESIDLGFYECDGTCEIYCLEQKEQMLQDAKDGFLPFMWLGSWADSPILKVKTVFGSADINKVSKELNWSVGEMMKSIAEGKS